MSWLSKFFSKSHKQRQLSSEDCCMHGQQAFAIGKYVEAMEYFQAAIEKDAQNEEAYLLLIDAYRALGRKKKKKKTIQKLQIEIPNHSPITSRGKPPVAPSGGNKQKSTPKREIVNPVLRGTVGAIKTVCSAIRTTSGAKLFRMILYAITTINVLQIFAALTDVVEWEVWEWELKIIGLVGVILEVFLPASLFVFGMRAIEKAPKVNHKKTNVLIIFFNAVCIFILCRFSIRKLPFDWSWNHLWLFFRPLVYLIGGSIALLIVLIIGSYLVLALSYLGRQIHKFFTT